MRSARDAMVSIEEGQRTQQFPGPAEPHVDATIAQLPGLEQKQQAIRSKLARGEQVTDDEINELQVDAAHPPATQTAPDSGKAQPPADDPTGDEENEPAKPEPNSDPKPEPGDDTKAPATAE